jgi:hypothetical protein
MGHGSKNANRGEAIMRNRARIEKLAEKIGEIGEQSEERRLQLKEELDALIEEFEGVKNELEERIDLLERSLWRKMMDKIKKVRKGNPADASNRAVIIKDGRVREEAHKRAEKEKIEKKGEK